MREGTRHTRKKTNPSYKAAATAPEYKFIKMIKKAGATLSYCYNAVVAAGRYGNASSDVNVEHDRHPQPASGGAQPHAKRVDARAGIMEVAIGKVL